MVDFDERTTLGILCTSSKKKRGRSERKMGRSKLPKRKMKVGKLDKGSLLFQNRRESLEDDLLVVDHI